jgi:uncharacterized membrane protein (DUF4010 family)
VGVVGASTVLLPRVLLMSTALNPRVAWALLPYLLPALIVGIGLTAALLLRRRDDETSAKAATPQSPLGLWSAIKMTLAFQVVLLLVPLIKEVWGAPGVLTSAGLLGLTDMDALTFAMARLADGADPVALGAKAIAVGILANSLLKLALTLVLGTAPFRRVASWGLLALGGASALGLWLRW